MSAAARLVSLVRITEVWAELGGGPLRNGRAKAFWREGDGLNIALDDAKNAWYDHARGEGGGVLDLVQHVRGGSRHDALRWLAYTYSFPLEDGRTLTLAERAEWGRRRQAAERAALPLARAALWWLVERCAELDDAKLAAIDGERFDVSALAVAAREQFRLQQLSPEDVVREYLRAREQDSENCERLVRTGQLWDRFCRAAARAVIARFTREQQEVSSNAR